MDWEVVISQYLEQCKQNSLDSKTLKAYRIDLKQFCEQVGMQPMTQEVIDSYVAELHKDFKPVKRKIASLRVFFRYLEETKRVAENPFQKVQVSIEEVSPETLPFAEIRELLATVERQCYQAKTENKRRMARRDVAVVQLLFQTGIRISELCSLTTEMVDLEKGILVLYGKGLRERKLQLDEKVQRVLKDYQAEFSEEIALCGYFFVNRGQKPLSEPVVRRVLQKYAVLGSQELAVTPKVLRNTLASHLLESGESLSYVQQLFGHSSVQVTERYSKDKKMITVACVRMPSLQEVRGGV